MPSAYLLAHRKVEEGRAVLASEIWFDAELNRYFSLLLARLELLETEVTDAVVLVPRHDIPQNAPRPIHRKSDSSVIPFVRK